MHLICSLRTGWHAVFLPNPGTSVFYKNLSLCVEEVNEHSWLWEWT